VFVTEASRQWNDRCSIIHYRRPHRRHCIHINATSVALRDALIATTRSVIFTRDHHRQFPRWRLPCSSCYVNPKDAGAKGAVMNTRIAQVSLLAFALPLACAAAPPSNATTSALAGDPRTWVDTATSFCLDSNADGNVYTLGCNGGSYQNWTNTRSTYGDTIVDEATGRCLDSNANGNVYTLPCNGGSYQQWTLTYTGAFGYEIKNVATQFCLDSNTSGNVYTLGCNGGNFQRWH
jgi:Ricin-type beta-trefoil lectin domain